MNKWECLDKQFGRLYTLLKGGEIGDMQYEFLHTQLISVFTTEDATQIGEKSLDLAGEQRVDGQVVAAEKQRKTCIHTVPYDEPCEACSSLD